MPGTEAEKIGSVSWERYERIVARLRDAVEKLSKNQFIVGDGGPEACLVQDRGGRYAGDDLFGVSAWLRRFSEDISHAGDGERTT
ncbi:hypothetical protein [Streptomyces melanogenes]|uniref:Uncharacterized protein n=1 Tax=Streptomyces melanogenes TaxID=67326 RepID=A0ABZ1XDH7_9ACTN|nr:hypothetical protein [Streptomyces melanogenes]